MRLHNIVAVLSPTCVGRDTRGFILTATHPRLRAYGCSHFPNCVRARPSLCVCCLSIHHCLSVFSRMAPMGACLDRLGFGRVVRVCFGDL